MKGLIKNSLVLIIFGILIPEIIVFLYNRAHYNDFRFTLQYILGFFGFFSSFALLLINGRGFANSQGPEKMARIIFILLSIIAILYLSILIYFQLVFRNGVGF